MEDPVYVLCLRFSILVDVYNQLKEGTTIIWKDPMREELRRSEDVKFYNVECIRMGRGSMKLTNDSRRWFMQLIKKDPFIHATAEGYALWVKFQLCESNPFKSSSVLQIQNQF